MKFICLGYSEEKNWDAMSQGEQDAMIEECFRYDDELLKHEAWTDGGQALQSARTAKTLRWKSGKVVVTDGPFAETKEQLGGFGVLEARDMDHAVELMSRHPGLRLGPFEIRPVDEQALARQRESDLKAKSQGAGAVASNANASDAKFLCLGYIDGSKGASFTKGDFEAMIDQCIAFDEARRRDGHWVSGVALQGATTAKTLRSREGKVLVTDGPFAETKEQLGGVVVLALADMKQAIDLLSNHPALRFGVVIEVRPADAQMNARWEARQAKLKHG